MHGRLGHDRSLHHTREGKSRDGKKIRPLRREANTFELDAAALIHFDRRPDATYLVACIAPGALVPIHRLQR